MLQKEVYIEIEMKLTEKKHYCNFRIRSIEILSTYSMRSQYKYRIKSELNTKHRNKNRAGALSLNKKHQISRRGEYLCDLLLTPQFEHPQEHFK